MPMSLEATSWALRQPVRDPVAKLILISLCDHHNPSTGRCFPSVARLAKAGCCSERTAQRKLAWLAAEGWIVVERYFTPSGRQERNTYRIQNLGCHAVTLPDKRDGGRVTTADTLEGDRAVSPLNRKKNDQEKGSASPADGHTASCPSHRASTESIPAGARRREIGALMKQLAASMRVQR
jgi:hypothetical protein